MNYAVVGPRGHIIGVVTGNDKSVPDAPGANFVPLAESRDPEPLTLSRRWCCTNCGNVIIEGPTGIASINSVCMDNLCRRGPQRHTHTTEILCDSCAEKWEKSHG